MGQYFLSVSRDDPSRYLYLSQFNRTKTFSIQFPRFGIFRRWTVIPQEEMMEKILKLQDDGYVHIYRRGG